MSNNSTETKAACGESSLTGGLEPLPCPFCGNKVDLEDYDTLYPSGVFWREDKELGMRTYHSRKNSLPSDKQCYAMHCPVPSGGCGAQVSGDSEAEAVAAWNRRSNADVTGLAPEGDKS